MQILFLDVLEELVMSSYLDKVVKVFLCLLDIHALPLDNIKSVVLASGCDFALDRETRRIVALLTFLREVELEACSEGRVLVQGEWFAHHLASLAHRHRSCGDLVK